jgi:hypothetical protein
MASEDTTGAKPERGDLVSARRPEKAAPAFIAKQ